MSSKQSRKAMIIVGGLLGCGCLSALAILAAVLAVFTIPKLIDSTEAAEQQMARDLVTQLGSASAVYTARQQHPPDNFTDFVSDDLADLSPQNAYTISLGSFGNGSCQVEETVIDCTPALTRTNARYYWDNGKISSEITSR